MHIIVIGCGIAGLACAVGLRKKGHQVTILERAPKVPAFGAGINMSPNASRALRSLGVLDTMLDRSYLPDHAAMHSYNTYKELSRQRLGNSMWKLYGAPFAVVHRFDLYGVLYEEACASNVEILFSHDVASIDLSTPSVTTSNGTVIKGDLLIGADGEKSLCREVVLQRPVIVKDSGFHVFRFMLKQSRIAKEVPHLKYLIEPPGIHLIVGPSGHAMVYCVKRDDLLNVVLAMKHDHIEDPPMLPHEVDLATIKEEFKGWVVVQDLLRLTDRCLRWTLINSTVAEKWSSNKMVLIGDAAHVMTPFVGQGAAMAIEDSVVLSNLLGNLPKDSPDALEQAFNKFHQLRHPRITFLQEKAGKLVKIYGYPDGPLQVERDQRLKSEMETLEASGSDDSKDVSDNFAKESPNFLLDVAFRRFVFEYDAEKVGKDACKDLGFVGHENGINGASS